MEYRYYTADAEKKREILEKLRGLLAARGVRLAVVFGSFVDLDSFRDIDVAIYIDGREELDALLKLGADLEEELGIPVDVAPLRELHPKFRLKVLTRGVVIVEEPGLYEALLLQALDELELLNR
ncbi:MAG: nucleotidyltransferase domain-containing protein [Pyrobaculum sp.]